MKASFALHGNEIDWTALKATMPHRFTCVFRDRLVDIAATSPRATALLRRVYRHFIETGAHARDAGALILIESSTAQAEALAGRLGRSAQSLDGYLLVANWLDFGLRIESLPLLHYYASKLLRLHVVERWDAETVTLHAASLRGPGGGFLLVGEAAAGKTTLTMRLLDDGFRYCADDTSCIRRADLACLPFPMSFIVRANAATGVPNAPALRGREPDIALLDEPRWLLERWDAVSTAFMPDTLYFASSDRADGEEVIRPMRKADAALALLRNLVMPLGADAESFSTAPRNFDLACRLAETCRCATLQTSDLDRAHRAILADHRAHRTVERIAV